MATKLEHVSLRDIVQDKNRLIMIPAIETLEKALRLMAEENITSIVIGDASKGLYTGIVNVYDIMVFLAFSGWDRVEEKNAKRLQTSIGSLKGVSVESQKLWSYDVNTPLRKVMEQLSKGVHRVLITGFNDNARLLSQTDIIHYFLKNSNLLPKGVLNGTLKQLGIHKPNNRLVTINDPNINALSAFRTMVAEDVTALVVLDQTGQAIGTLSASDLRGLTPEKFSDLNLPVIEFITRYQHEDRPAIVALPPSIPLRDAMQVLIDNRIHRLWITSKKDWKIDKRCFNE